MITVAVMFGLGMASVAVRMAAIAVAVMFGLSMATVAVRMAVMFGSGMSTIAMRMTANVGCVSLLETSTCLVNTYFLRFP